MFLLNSCLSLFSAASSQRHPLSRSYGVILPSSLTMLLPPALGFSPHPPVSVYGTGTVYTIAAFLGSWNLVLRYLLFAPHHTFSLCDGFAYHTDNVLAPVFPFPAHLIPLRPHISKYCSAGISTCCPSATPFGLALGPDLPRADQLYPGNLGYSAVWILTILSLLIPAFSLPIPPQLLIGTASTKWQCSSTTHT